MALLRDAAALLPGSLRQELRRWRYRRQIRRQRFVPNEPEIALLPSLLAPGDWALDIGANVGHYTLAMAALVGARGRVLAVEPISETFDLLTSNVLASGYGNVSALNVAASAVDGLVSMQVPKYGNGRIEDYYLAHIAAHGDRNVLCVRLDSLPYARRIAVVKIDAEDHEISVLQGMTQLLARDRPTLIVESGVAGELPDYLRSLGFSIEIPGGTPNIIARPSGQ